jgi:hypothetical protein
MRIPRTSALTCLAVSVVLSTPAAAQSTVEKLTFYGFLNQAYGVSNAQPILGLQKDASGDYRAAALQVRYALSPNDNFVVQAGSRAMGTSPYSPTAGSVSLDWAFYHHRFDWASVRLGRVPVPFGYLSETREVGTLLPFYRAPASYYLESFRSLDGGMLTNEVDVPVTGGSLETTLFAGGTNGSTVTWLPTTSVTSKLRFERLIGFGLIYKTPVEGLSLRGGLASLRSLDTAKVQLAPATKLVILSGGAEALYDRFMFRGEARRIKIGSNSKQYSTYGQTGVRVLDKLWVNGQVDLYTGEAFVAPLNAYVGRSTADRALSAAYHFSSHIVGKFEQHFATGGIDAYIPASAEMPYTNYSLASVAISF